MASEILGTRSRQDEHYADRPTRQNGEYQIPVHAHRMGMKTKDWTQKFCSMMDEHNRQAFDLHFTHVDGWTQEQHCVPLIDIFLAESKPMIRRLNQLFKSKHVHIDKTAEELYDWRKWLRAIHFQTVNCTGKNGWQFMLQETASKNTYTNWPQQEQMKQLYDTWKSTNKRDQYDTSYRSFLAFPVPVEIGNISYWQFKNRKITAHSTDRFMVSSQWVAVMTHLPGFKAEDEKDNDGYGKLIPTVDHIKFGTMKHLPLNNYFYNASELAKCPKRSSLVNALSNARQTLVCVCVCVSACVCV